MALFANRTIFVMMLHSGCSILNYAILAATGKQPGSFFLDFVRSAGNITPTEKMYGKFRRYFDEVLRLSI